MRAARIVPERQNGKTVGIRFRRVTPDSLLGITGLQNGDWLDSVNGFDITSPEKALEAWARLPMASAITVAINRSGKPVTIDYRNRRPARVGSEGMDEEAGRGDRCAFRWAVDDQGGERECWC